MPPSAPRARLKIALLLSAVGASGVVGLDLLGEPLCLRLPLLYYLVAGAAGGAVGALAARWIAARAFWRNLVFRLGAVAVLAGVGGALWLALDQPSEDSRVAPTWAAKCASHYCARLLGPGPWRSPYPIDPPVLPAAPHVRQRVPVLCRGEPGVPRAHRGEGMPASVSAIGIILGSAFSSGEVPFALEPVRVDTPWGACTIHRATDAGGAAILFRHGRPYRHLPHQIPYRAHAWALGELGCRSLLVTSSVGVLDPAVPLFAPLLVEDVITLDNRLPDGSPCTLFSGDRELPATPPDTSSSPRGWSRRRSRARSPRSPGSPRSPPPPPGSPRSPPPPPGSSSATAAVPAPRRRPRTGCGAPSAPRSTR